MEGWTECRQVGWTDRWTDGQIDGQTDGSWVGSVDSEWMDSWRAEGVWSVGESCGWMARCLGGRWRHVVGLIGEWVIE